jgi:hypothetical protein
MLTTSRHGQITVFAPSALGDKDFFGCRLRSLSLGNLSHDGKYEEKVLTSVLRGL